IPNQSFRQINAFHNVVALVYTSGTVHTFQLRTISNIYSGRANMYTLQTIYTITMSQGFPVFPFSKFLSTVFTFPTFMVVSNHYRFVVQKHALQTAIRTSNNTYLLSKPSKNKIKYSCKNN